MQTFQNTVTIARPAEEVFAFLADLRNIPKWNCAIERTAPTSPGPAGAGATYRQTRTKLSAATGGRRDPADQRCRAGTYLSPAAAGRPAGRTENQGGRGSQPQHAETAAGKRLPGSRRQTVTPRTHPGPGHGLARSRRCG
jgi:hypothetical protein